MIIGRQASDADVLRHPDGHGRAKVLFAINLEFAATILQASFNVIDTKMFFRLAKNILLVEAYAVINYLDDVFFLPLITLNKDRSALFLLANTMSI